MDVSDLLREHVPAEHRRALDYALQKYPPGDRGLDPRLFKALARAGVLQIGELVEAVSDEPIRPVVQVGGRDRHQVVARLGRGGMAEVLLAYDRALSRYVALKVMEGTFAKSDDWRRRFEAEARITAQLQHPCIVTVFDLKLEPDGRPVYTMEVVRGRTLLDMVGEAHDAVAAGRPQPGHNTLDDRLSAFLDVCDAVSYAHTRGVLHRDLKLENIMVGRFHQTLVMDWGLAVRIGEDDGTPAGHVVGTPSYMSPEQATERSSALDGRSDLYALGLILQEIVTLRRARTGNTLDETIAQAVDAVRQPVRPLGRERIPRGLRGIIEKATARRIDARYATVDDLAEDLRRFLRDEPVRAKPDTVLQAIGRQVARHRTLVLALIFVLTTALLGAVLVAVGGAVAVNELARHAARQREERLAVVTDRVRGQAARIDGAVHFHQGQLMALAGAVEHGLVTDPPDLEVILQENLTEGTGRQPAMQPSAFYDSDVTLEEPDLVLAPDADPEALHRQLQQLTHSSLYFRRALVQSIGPDARHLDPAAIDARVREQGAPLVWTYAGTETGILAGYPGVWEYPDDYDPRVRYWYKAALASETPVWTVVEADEGGMGLLLSGTVRLLDPQGEIVGVAGVDLTFAHVIDTLLEPDGGLPDGVEVWLIDKDGNAMIRSSQRQSAREAPPGWTPPPFPDQALIAELRSQGASGHRDVVFDQDGVLAVWAPVPILDWTYVLMGPEEAVLQGW